MRRNRETLASLQKENKELRAQLQAFSRAAHPQSASAKPIEDEQDINLRKAYDTVRNRALDRKRGLQILNDKLKELSSDKSEVETPQQRTIRLLENRLDKAMIKYNEAQSIRKTYEQIVKRLKDERVGYDNQLAAIERSLKGKEHDFEELLLLSHDANHAKEVSEANLRRFEAQITVERMMRDKEVQEKKSAVQQRMEMTQRMEEKTRKEKEEREGKQKEQIVKLSQQMAEAQQSKIEEERHKIQDYDEAFRRIKEATGVSDVNEVIQKFTTQEDTLNNLQELKKDNQQKLESLIQLKKDLREQVESLKYAGGESMSRKQVDEVEQNVQAAQNKLERNKLKQERISKILVDVKAGIEHLNEKLDPIKIEGQFAITVTDENLADALIQNEQKIVKLYMEIKESQTWKQLQVEKQKHISDPNTQPSILLQAIPRFEQASKVLEASRPYNIRVKVQELEEDEMSDEGLEDENETAVTDRIKQKQDAQLRYERSNKNRIKRQKKGGNQTGGSKKK